MFGFKRRRKLYVKAQQPDPQAIFVAGRSGTRLPLFEPKERPLQEQFRGWAYIANMRNATALASLPCRVLTIDTGPNTKALDRRLRSHLRKNKAALPYFTEDTREVTDHPILSVLANPNPLLDQAGLITLTVNYLQMRANAYWYVVQNQLGEPLQFWPLPAQFMRVVMGENVIQGYELLHMGGQINFDPDEIVHFRLPGPTDTIRGFGPVDAVGEEMETDLRMNEYERAVFENNALPDYLVTPERGEAVMAEGQDTALQEVMTANFGGWRKKGKGWVFRHPLKVTTLSQTNRDLQFKDGKRPIREKIAAGFGVPDALLSLDGATFANMAKGKQLWSEFTVTPMSMHIMGRINQKVMIQYGTRRSSPTDPNSRPIFWLVQDSPVTEDEFEQAQQDTLYINSDVLTRDEVRSNLGREPHEDGRGSEPLPQNAAFQVESVAPPDGEGEGDGQSEEEIAQAADEDVAATINELTLGMERLARFGDVDGVNVLRQAMAEALGVTLPDLTAEDIIQQPEPGSATNGDSDKGDSKPNERTVDDDDTKGAACGGGGEVPIHDDTPEPEAFTPRTHLEEFAFAIHPEVDIKLSQPRIEHGLEDKKFIAAMRAEFKAMKKTALAHVPDFSKSAPATEGKSKTDDAFEKMFPQHKYEESVATAATPFMVEAFFKGAELGHKDLQKKKVDLGSDLLIVPETVLKQVDRLAETFASVVVETTGDQLARILREGVEKGWNHVKMTKLVEETFKAKDENAAKRIVRTETSNVLNQGAASEWKAAGIKKHQWLAAPNPCEFCEKMDGRVRTIGKAFLKRGDAIIGTKGGRHVARFKTIMAPSLHPNCVCTLIPIVE